MTEIQKTDRDFFSSNWEDEDGNHQGGQSFGSGFSISWQRGPMPEGDLKHQNGALLITVLSALIEQLRYYQSGKFYCEENAKALDHLMAARHYLDSRKERRKEQGVLGTSEPERLQSTEGKTDEIKTDEIKADETGHTEADEVKTEES